jgi:putative heme-binding domain-containing protein
MKNPAENGFVILRGLATLRQSQPGRIELWLRVVFFRQSINRYAVRQFTLQGDHEASEMQIDSRRIFCFWLTCCTGLLMSNLAAAQNPTTQLQRELASVSAAELAEEAARFGDAKRGAVLFYQPQMACRQCHSVDGSKSPLGPALSEKRPDVTNAFLVDSVLHPSKVIRKGFETAVVVTNDGKVVTGLIVEETPQKVVIRDGRPLGKVMEFSRDDIDEYQRVKQSIMPPGQVSMLASRQQFLDLIRYLIEVRDGGALRAKELEPPASLYAIRIPEYEKDIDHSAMISDLDDGSFKRGQAIYNRLCVNCHGNHDKPGSLPTSLRFATGKFRNGFDPHTMYQTLTRGFGMMVAQTWMVPQQKYDVIHYVREAYLRKDNPTQHLMVTDEYLAGLPKGKSRGPEPSQNEPWITMDYGPSLVNTYEVGNDGTNFAYKGIAVRLDPGPGGVSRGQSWMVFDHDTMRVAAAWTGQGFIDWQGIHMNGRHNIHPRVKGDVHLANPTGPGWANPDSGTFDDPRLRGRDDRQYGPLPRKWAHYKGLSHHGQKTIIEYTVGDTRIHEMPGLATPVGNDTAAPPVFSRTFNIGPRSRELTLQVAREPEGSGIQATLDQNQKSLGMAVSFGLPGTGEQSAADARAAGSKQKLLEFNGKSFVEISDASYFDTTSQDFTLTARIRTKSGGTIFSRTKTGEKWIPDGQTLFVRNGQLAFDIGWVGAVQSRQRVNDGKWHDVAMTWDSKTKLVQLFVDGKPDQSRELATQKSLRESVFRIGFTNSNFPGPQSFFDGGLRDVRFYQRLLSNAELSKSASLPADESLKANWKLDEPVPAKPAKKTAVAAAGDVPDATGNGHTGTIHSDGTGTTADRDERLAAGIQPAVAGAKFIGHADGALILQIPAGREPLQFTLWFQRRKPDASLQEITADFVIEEAVADLASLTNGGPARWPVKLTTTPIIGSDSGAFAVDVLSHPADNPWLAQTRLTGFDFLPDGDRVAVCAWDGDVWMVSGLSQLPNIQSEVVPEQPPKLTWQRIASGLFQPLGLKYVDGQIFVTCRDQIVILRDRNGDGETDYYENFNNDHQVTDHFHEFAMGLQTDDAGNFYYAKSARHALKALVPHHGTLLRVSRDGSKTDIIAAGFRAANGVCLNPDGTFIVTDQEGHWNPKNRINWVREGGFYGNMFGYHDVTDSSDDAMEQPLCWITNAFDRSPAELLWCDSERWGPFKGSLLNLSYGYGKIFVVPHENLDGQMQGGMCELPIPQFPTGLMRGRFNPHDGQLYACGMVAWGSAQRQPGGIYRIRYTGKPAYLPVQLEATPRRVKIVLSDPVKAESAADTANYRVKVWSLKRAASYGSKHYDEHALEVASASLSPDGRTIELTVPDVAPTWGMEIRYALQGVKGESAAGVIHNTIHKLGE